MRSVLVKSPGKIEDLCLGEAPKPLLNSKEVLIKSKATSVNRMDLLQRMGKYPVPKDTSEILGVDVSGIVQEVSPDCRKLKKGDEVFGLLQGGGYAEFAKSHEDLLWKKPSNLNFIEAAAIPEVFMTAYQTLYWLGELSAHKNVLIHAGASGVGSAAIQLCHLINANAYVTASSSEKIKYCMDLGAKRGINYKKENFLEVLQENKLGIDIVLDFIGAPNFKMNIQSLNQAGKFILISYMGGYKIDEFDLRTIHSNWIELKGTTLRSRPQGYRIKLAQELGTYLIPLIEAGKISTLVDKVFTLNEVQSAHEYMEKNLNKGKIILTID